MEIDFGIGGLRFGSGITRFPCFFVCFVFSSMDICPWYQSGMGIIPDNLKDQLTVGWERAIRLNKLKPSGWLDPSVFNVIIEDMMVKISSQCNICQAKVDFKDIHAGFIFKSVLCY